MAAVAPPFTGVYELDRNHSTVQFAVRHVQVSIFRASFADIDARLTVEDGTMRSRDAHSPSPCRSSSRSSAITWSVGWTSSMQTRIR